MLVLTQLNFFEIRLNSWTHANSPLRPIAPDHGVLQSLAEFRFKGVCECLEYIVGRLDAPKNLNRVLRPAIIQQFQESPCWLLIGLGILCCALGRRVYSLSNISSRPQEQTVDSTQWLDLLRSFPDVKALGGK